MKNKVLIVLLLLSFLGYSQRVPNIKGNKNVVEVREELPQFKAIELNDDLEIFLQKSATTGYTIVADDNLIDILKFKVVDSTLIVSSFYNITAKKKLEITINYNELESITLLDGKMAVKESISTDHLDISTYGSADLELIANTSTLNLFMEGNSTGDLNLESDSLNITLKDKIDVRIYSVSERNSVEMNNGAVAILEGTTETLWVKLLGKTKLKAELLEAASIKVTMEDSPLARLNALTDFELSSRGASKTYLYGNPKVTILEFLNTSELHKEQN